MTIANEDLGRVQFNSPPAEIPGLVKPQFGAGDDGMSTDPEPEPPARKRIGPVLNAQPVLMKAIRQWGLLVGLAVWVYVVVPIERAVFPAIGLLLFAGIARAVIDHRISRGKLRQREGMALSNLILLVAVGVAGLAGATLVSPVTLIVPGIVWSVAAVAPKQWVASLGTRIGVLLAAGISVLSASRFAEHPTSTASTVALGGTMVLATLVAAVHGRQAGSRLLEMPLDDAEEGGQTGADASIRSAIASQSEPTGIARTAARAISERFSPGYVAIVEHVPHDNMFTPLAEVVDDPELAHLGRRLAGITDSATASGGPFWMLDDGDDSYTITCRRLGIHAALVLPLEHLSHRVGAIQIAWSKPVGPMVLSEALSYVTDLAAMITPDLAIAQFASEIERGYFTAISSLAAKVDDRDDFTRGHSRRVARHALTIAEALELDEHQQRMLLYAAELHDIGRIGVSEHILSKTDALSASEWAEIRSYPRISADIVEPLSFFSDVREIVLHQNERWDGKGYPDRLAGMEIPLLSRILAVADAYDAMTSPRAYRSAMPPQQAMTELWKARGTKYDPDVVEAFIMSVNGQRRIA